MEKIDNIIFYSLDKAIKSYRQMAQNKLKAAKLDITVDQWLILNMVSANPEMSQQDIAESVFKDNASVTRILDLLVRKGYIKRTVLDNDRRRAKLLPAKKGEALMKKASKVVNAYRKTALKEINESDLKRTRNVLDTIIINCNKHLK